MEAVMSFVSGDADAHGRAAGVADSPSTHAVSNDVALR